MLNYDIVKQTHAEYEVRLRHHQLVQRVQQAQRANREIPRHGGTRGLFNVLDGLTRMVSQWRRKWQTGMQ
jgi:hypothetical protein